MRVGNPKLVVEPGAGRTGKLAMVAYQFQQDGSTTTPNTTSLHEARVISEENAYTY